MSSRCGFPRYAAARRPALWAPNQISFRDGRALDASQSSVGFPDSAELQR